MRTFHSRDNESMNPIYGDSYVMMKQKNVILRLKISTITFLTDCVEPTVLNTFPNPIKISDGTPVLLLSVQTRMHARITSVRGHYLSRGMHIPRFSASPHIWKEPDGYKLFEIRQS